MKFYQIILISAALAITGCSRTPSPSVEPEDTQKTPQIPASQESEKREKDEKEKKDSEARKLEEKRLADHKAAVEADQRKDAEITASTVAAVKSFDNKKILDQTRSVVAKASSFHFFNYADIALPGTSNEEKKALSIEFWEWAIKNPNKIDSLLTSSLAIVGQLHDLKKELAGTKLITLPVNIADLRQYVSDECLEHGEKQAAKLESCTGLTAKYGEMTATSLYLAEFLIRRHNNGGQNFAEKFRKYLHTLSK